MITKDMLIADIVQNYPEVVPTLMWAGMGCIGCAISHSESLEGGAMAHGLDPDELVKALNETLASIKGEQPEQPAAQA